MRTTTTGIVQPRPDYDSTGSKMTILSYPVNRVHELLPLAR
ncbi:hypothetical protein AWB69_08800 [Caballeronia udeis]|uniref:Uncharacterized protein n=1 Tax=Caballeronia udeis TaxID=1232866 RepID=A0A158JUL2_9BURK|nr:hypothetical protein AWB69_08800 [Caballeronia udeis]